MQIVKLQDYLTTVSAKKAACSLYPFSLFSEEQSTQATTHVEQGSPRDKSNVCVRSMRCIASQLAQRPPEHPLVHQPSRRAERPLVLQQCRRAEHRVRLQPLPWRPPRQLTLPRTSLRPNPAPVRATSPLFSRATNLPTRRVAHRPCTPVFIRLCRPVPNPRPRRFHPRASFG